MVQVLNQTSVWWFDNTKHITDNAVVSAPDPNVTIAKKCTVFPVEFVGITLLTSIASHIARSVIQLNYIQRLNLDSVGQMVSWH